MEFVTPYEIERKKGGETRRLKFINAVFLNRMTNTVA